MNIELNQIQTEIVRSAIASGKYSNAEAVIAEMISLFQIKRMREQIAIGAQQIANGQITDGESVFYDLQSRLTR